MPQPCPEPSHRKSEAPLPLSGKSLVEFVTGLRDYAAQVGGDRGQFAILLRTRIEGSESINVEDLAETIHEVLRAEQLQQTYELRHGLDALLKLTLPEDEAFIIFAEQVAAQVRRMVPPRARALTREELSTPVIPEHLRLLKKLRPYADAEGVAELLSPDSWSSATELLRFLQAKRLSGLREPHSSAVEQTMRALVPLSVTHEWAKISERLPVNVKNEHGTAIRTMLDSLRRGVESMRHDAAKKLIAKLPAKFATSSDKQVAGDVKFALTLFSDKAVSDGSEALDDL